MTQMASMDFFVVPTATFRVLFVFLVLSHDRRRIRHWNITEHPTEEWTIQQLREAFPWDEAVRYLVRDRDAIFGKRVGATIQGMGIEAHIYERQHSIYQSHRDFRERQKTSDLLSVCSTICREPACAANLDKIC